MDSWNKPFCFAFICNIIHRYGRSQEENPHAEANFKTIYKQLATKQEEIDSLREKLEKMKALPQEVQFLNAALNVGHSLATAVCNDTTAHCVTGRTISNRTIRRTNKWLDWAPSERSGKFKASNDRHGGESAVSKWRTTEGHTRNVRALPNKGLYFYLIPNNFLFYLIIVHKISFEHKIYLLDSKNGTPGTATAAVRHTRRFRQLECPSPCSKTHKCVAHRSSSSFASRGNWSGYHNAISSNKVSINHLYFFALF